jgi:hypothetical protein
MPDRLAAAGAESSGTPALPSLAEVWRQSEEIYRACFSQVDKTAALSIPIATKPTELFDFLGTTSDLLKQSTAATT